VNRASIAIVGVGVVAAMALIVAGCGGGGSGSAAQPRTTTGPLVHGITPGLGLTTKSCGQLIDIPVTFTNATTGLPSNLRDVTPVLDRYARAAPFQIRPSFKVLADASTKITTILKGVDLYANLTPAVVAKLRKLTADINAAAITDSGADVSAWAQQNCGTRG
jgi:hypothetical protein